MKILAIETSFDDTSISILKDNIVLSLITYSQYKHQQISKGIIPEKSSRIHTKKIFILIEIALKRANTKLEDIDVIAVTNGPGLLTTLQVGFTVAKMLAYQLKIPFYPINHLKGHLFSPFIGEEKKLIPQKFIFLLISGGHTLIGIYDNRKLKILGNTLDDAIGEAYDKVARTLKLELPGGPSIDEIYFSMLLNNEHSKLKSPIVNLSNYNFSYSGLKSWVIQKNKEYSCKDIAFAFQEGAIEQLLIKVKKAMNEFQIYNLVVGGGVAANKYLRSKLKKDDNIQKLFLPKLIYTGDNAAMIGYAFYVEKDYLEIGNLLSDAIIGKGIE